MARQAHDAKSLRNLGDRLEKCAKRLAAAADSFDANQIKTLEIQHHHESLRGMARIEKFTADAEQCIEEWLTGQGKYQAESTTPKKGRVVKKKAARKKAGP